MTQKLYFGSLWFEATATELQEWFGRVEAVDAVPITAGRKQLADADHMGPADHGTSARSVPEKQPATD